MNHITTILEDLYKLDPGFRKYEPELKKLIENVLLSKPDTRFDEEFARNLRASLMATPIVSAPVVSPYVSPVRERSRVSTFPFMRWGYAAASFAVLVLIILPFINTKTSVFSQRFTTRGTQQFGPLLQNDQIPATTNLIPTTENYGSTLHAPSSGAGLYVASNTVGVPRAKTAALTASPSPTGRYATLPVVPAYAYSYDGDPINLTSDQGTVYRREKGFASGTEVSDLLGALHMDSLDPATFTSLKVRNIELAEADPQGYSIVANFDEGVMSIQSNTSFASGAADNTANAASTTIISLAKDFINKHAIDISYYASPVFDDTSSNVIFPLTIKGTEVYEQNGMPYGLYVGVDPKEKKVRSVTNLTSQSYDSSSYALTTDVKSIMDALAKSSGSAHAATTTKISLGTPKKVLMRYYDTKNDSTSELYVPALLFPITSKGYIADHVVVPLVKDLLATYDPLPVSSVTPDSSH